MAMTGGVVPLLRLAAGDTLHKRVDDRLLQVSSAVPLRWRRKSVSASLSSNFVFYYDVVFFFFFFFFYLFFLN
jgi:hypothetical protein